MFSIQDKLDYLKSLEIDFNKLQKPLASLLTSYQYFTFYTYSHLKCLAQFSQKVFFFF